MLKISGFVGIESYDLILLLAQAIKMTGTPVTIADVSYDRSLQYAVPDLTSDTTTQFSDITYLSQKDLSLPQATGSYLLIYFGKNPVQGLLQKCSDVFLVTDYQKHNISFIRELQLPEEAYRFLIIRYKITNKITPDYVCYELKDLGIEQDAIFSFDDSPQDLGNQILLQYNADKTVHKVSQEILNCIACALSGDYEDDTIKRIVKQFRR